MPEGYNLTAATVAHVKSSTKPCPACGYGERLVLKTDSYRYDKDHEGIFETGICVSCQAKDCAFCSFGETKREVIFNWNNGIPETGAQLITHRPKQIPIEDLLYSYAKECRGQEKQAMLERAAETIIKLRNNLQSTRAALGNYSEFPNS